MTMIFAMDTEGMTNLAAYVSQLVREGVTFSISNDKISAEVKLTGGY